MVAETKKVAAKQWDNTLTFDYTNGLGERKLKTSALAYLVPLEGEVKLDVVTFRMQCGAKYKDDLALGEEKDAPPPYSKGAMHDHSIIVLVGPETANTGVILALRELADLLSKPGTFDGFGAATARR